MLELDNSGLTLNHSYPFMPMKIFGNLRVLMPRLRSYAERSGDPESDEISRARLYVPLGNFTNLEVAEKRHGADGLFHAGYN